MLVPWEVSGWFKHTKGKAQGGGGDCWCETFSLSFRFLNGSGSISCSKSYSYFGESRNRRYCLPWPLRTIRRWGCLSFREEEPHSENISLLRYKARKTCSACSNKEKRFGDPTAAQPHRFCPDFSRLCFQPFVFFPAELLLRKWTRLKFNLIGCEMTLKLSFGCAKFLLVFKFKFHEKGDYFCQISPHQASAKNPQRPVVDARGNSWSQNNTVNVRYL